MAVKLKTFNSGCEAWLIDFCFLTAYHHFVSYLKPKIFWVVRITLYKDIVIWQLLNIEKQTIVAAKYKIGNQSRETWQMPTEAINIKITKVSVKAQNDYSSYETWR